MKRFHYWMVARRWPRDALPGVLSGQSLPNWGTVVVNWVDFVVPSCRRHGRFEDARDGIIADCHRLDVIGVHLRNEGRIAHRLIALRPTLTQERGQQPDEH